MVPLLGCSRLGRTSPPQPQRSGRPCCGAGGPPALPAGLRALAVLPQSSLSSKAPTLSLAPKAVDEVGQSQEGQSSLGRALDPQH